MNRLHLLLEVLKIDTSITSPVLKIASTDLEHFLHVQLHECALTVFQQCQSHLEHYLSTLCVREHVCVCVHAYTIYIIYCTYSVHNVCVNLGERGLVAHTHTHEPR